jgi:kinesin family protein C2/C3
LFTTHVQIAQLSGKSKQHILFYFQKKPQALKAEHQILLQESLECKKFVADATQMTTTIQQHVNQYASLECEFKDLKEKFTEETKERKDLYNKLIEVKGNIRVFCRCRPLNGEEIEEGASMAVDFESAKDGELIVRGHVSSKKVFKFDSVFSPEEDQEKVFEKTVPFATSVLDGYNVCIFAYGQTGTGKTFTMEGIEDARGVNYRTLEELFRITKERQGLFQYEITVSVLEVYNEQIHDLLLTGTQPGATAKRYVSCEF